MSGEKAKEYFLVVDKDGKFDYGADEDWAACHFCADCNEFDFYERKPYRVIKVSEAACKES